MGDFLLGEIKLWPMNWAPEGWLLCNGQLLSIQQYTALYSLLGVNYGGNGTTTFGLPDLRGRVPVGYGQLANTSSVYNLGQVGGHESQALSQAQLPQHTHASQLSLTGGTATTSVNVGTDSNNPIAQPAAGQTVYLTAASAAVGRDPVTLSGLYTNQDPGSSAAHLGGAATQLSGLQGSVTVQNAGASSPVDMRQPYQVVNYIICTNGIYPSRP